MSLTNFLPSMFSGSLIAVTVSEANSSLGNICNPISFAFALVNFAISECFSKIFSMPSSIILFREF